MPHVNELHDNSMPTEAAVGVLPGDAAPDQIAERLVAAGIDDDRIYFFQGDEGVSIIEKAGNFVTRLLESERREEPVGMLKAGQTLIAVYGVDKDDAAAVRASLSDSGVDDIRYFGRWTY